MHYLNLFDAEMEALYNTISQDYLTSDLDNDGMPDRYQVGLVAYVLSVQTHPYSNLVHDLYASTIASLQTEPNYAAQIQPYHHALAALMICLQDMADFWKSHFSLGGTYTSFVITKTASEPFSALGDLDQDGVTNGEEYQNNEDAGGDIDSFMAAANNPELERQGASRDGNLGRVALRGATSGLRPTARSCRWQRLAVRRSLVLLLPCGRRPPRRE